MKTCEACRHSEANTKLEFMLCRHPEISVSALLSVTAKSTDYCSVERAQHAGWRSLWVTKCGRQGRLWEPK